MSNYLSVTGCIGASLNLCTISKCKHIDIQVCELF